ncbi:Crp/Fnr family transcriptional regulator [Dehalococcoides mccartyi]|nr:Crp/Fnr family transcriptional regulator [Dehalococcoides mccartyi]
MSIDVYENLIKRCNTFDIVERSVLSRWIESEADGFKVVLLDPDSSAPFIEAGSECVDAFLLRQGEVIPWTYPSTFLPPPFLIGQHEMLMEHPSWQSQYSVTKEGTAIAIPIEALTRLMTQEPSFKDAVLQTVLSRTARFYWTSLSTGGPVKSRVAAAILSRIAIKKLPMVGRQNLKLAQTDLMRLTLASRPSVALAVTELVGQDLIQLGDGDRYSGEIFIPDVKLLIDALKEGPIGKLLPKRAAGEA